MARYIDAEAAIDAARRSPVGRLMIKKHNLDGWLLGLPAADVAPVRHGRWLDAEYEHVNTGEIRLGRRCSECGAGYFRYDVSVNTVSDIPRYCPNCGAKMDGSDGDD